jgi:glycosyltransferase involved in cell wall biosynthesis
VEALASLARSRPGLVLLMAGRSGHVSEELRGMVSAGRLEGTVRFLGHREDVPDVLAAADVFVFPSLYEGLGGALIEAMALGLPVVASDIPAVREVVEPGGNAVLVPPATPAAIAAGVAGMLDDPSLRARFGARSRELFERRFTLDRAVEGTLGLYRRLVAGDLRVAPAAGAPA